MKACVGIEEKSFSAFVTLSNPLGLHTRPATLIVQLLQPVKCEVHFTHIQKRVSAKSVLNLLILAAKKGDEILIESQGEDAESTLAAVVDLFERGFGEV